jgi:hypothetical protein
MWLSSGPCKTHLGSKVEDLALLSLNELLEALLGEIGVGSELIELGDVTSVVLLHSGDSGTLVSATQQDPAKRKEMQTNAVVEGHGLRRDVRGKSVLLVRERGKSEGHVVEMWCCSRCCNRKKYGASRSL